jgi:ABC-type phosphate/phosphonate transport system permease subunit
MMENGIATLRHTASLLVHWVQEPGYHAVRAFEITLAGMTIALLLAFIFGIFIGANLARPRYYN